MNNRMRRTCSQMNVKFLTSPVFRRLKIQNTKHNTERNNEQLGKDANSIVNV